MTRQQSVFTVRLFYSYCHKDARHRVAMERSLAFLKQEGLLKDWSDQSILPGQSISQKVREEMDRADIMVFFLSQDFIASEACIKEWRHAKQLSQRKSLFRIPVILRDCAWKDLLASDDIKALPTDGKPVAEFTDADAAWQQVYEGVKDVINQLRNTFTPKSEFIGEIEKTDFLSQQHLKLKDIFVFPRLSCYAPQTKDGQVQEKIVTNREELLKKKYTLIHGEEMSGKTALGRHLFLSLVEKSPVLHMDLEQVSKRHSEKIFPDIYQRQFNGDYNLWKLQNNKTLILDNLSSSSNLIDFIVFAKKFFDRIVVTLSSDVFNSYFRDEKRFAEFVEMKIEPLTHRQQEELIRKRLMLSDRHEPITDGYVDQVESRVNSTIISNKIVPRYPFFVLSILQTYEAFMPDNMRITSHGHCYYVLILANLIKAGIDRSDDAINVCLHFAENLSFRIYQCAEQGIELDFNGFVSEYQKKFIIPKSILRRLQNHDYGIVTRDGGFKTSYMHYFFLGRFLSKNGEEYRDVIERMCKESHVTSNHLTLLFIIHHTNDNQIIDDILLRTMCTLDVVRPAVLDSEETKIFRNLVDTIPKNILSKDSVEAERGKERDARDDTLDHQVETKEKEQTENEDIVNDLYRILKNNEILGQVLKNKYGTLERAKIEEIVEEVADSGLRLINLVLRDEKEIADNAHYLQKKHPDDDIQKIENILLGLSFLWIMLNVEKIVGAINHPEIREVVNEVVHRRATPAYELIGYFSQLDSATKLTKEIKRELSILLKKHDDRFLKSVLSIRTQHYLNTHRSDVSIEQSVCSLLGIKYVPRLQPRRMVKKEG